MYFMRYRGLRLPICSKLYLLTTITYSTSDMISKFRIRNFVGVVFHGVANSKLHGNELLSTLTLANWDSQLHGNQLLSTLTLANQDSQLCGNGFLLT
jgi:hypothetical protein